MSNDVKNPSHYNRGKIEVWEYSRGNVEVWELNEDEKMDYYTVNAVKYIARAGFKDPSKEVEDLQKAITFLERKIKVLEKDKDGQVEEKRERQLFEESLSEEGMSYLECRYSDKLFTLTECIQAYKYSGSLNTKITCLIAYYVALEYAQLFPNDVFTEIFKQMESVMKELKLFE